MFLSCVSSVKGVNPAIDNPVLKFHGLVPADQFLSVWQKPIFCYIIKCNNRVLIWNKANKFMCLMHIWGINISWGFLIFLSLSSQFISQNGHYVKVLVALQTVFFPLVAVILAWYLYILRQLRWSFTYFQMILLLLAVALLFINCEYPYEVVTLITEGHRVSYAELLYHAGVTFISFLHIFWFLAFFKNSVFTKVHIVRVF